MMTLKKLDDGITLENDEVIAIFSIYGDLDQF